MLRGVDLALVVFDDEGDGEGVRFGEEGGFVVVAFFLGTVAEEAPDMGAGAERECGGGDVPRDAGGDAAGAGEDGGGQEIVVASRWSAGMPLRRAW
jgi:hypothetical protein